MAESPEAGVDVVVPLCRDICILNYGLKGHYRRTYRRMSRFAVGSFFLTLVSAPPLLCVLFTGVLTDFFIGMGNSRHEASRLTFSCLMVPTLVSLCCCFIAGVEVQARREYLRGAGFAMAGIGVCVLWLLSGYFLLFILVF